MRSAQPAITLIAAVDETFGIGRAGSIPWHHRGDLRRFRDITLGGWVIMGRATWDSLKRPLTGRTNVVVSANLSDPAPGVLVAGSLDAALSLAGSTSARRVFVIGGQRLYQDALPGADSIELTRITGRHDCDRFFPAIDPASWSLISRTDGGDGAAYEHWKRIRRA